MFNYSFYLFIKISYTPSVLFIAAGLFNRGQTHKKSEESILLLFNLSLKKLEIWLLILYIKINILNKINV
jgi:hypothetical protein